MNKIYKKILGLSIIFGVVLSSFHSFPSHIVQAIGSNSTDHVVIYFSPHADDETLTFAVPILNDIQAGKKVYIVLMSDGTRSRARDTVNGEYDFESRDLPIGKQVYCNWHNAIHDPTVDQHKDGALDRSTFGLRRIDEFYVATAELGIPRDRVQVNLLPNDAFTYHNVKQIIKMHARLFPDAEFKTMSHRDGHPDHAMVGRVINDMHASGEIKSKSNYLSIYTDRFYKHSFASPGYKIYLTDTSDTQKVLHALNAYKKWEPQNGWYGLGYHSVPAQFDGMAQDTYTKAVRN
ncbi:PIG-L family deacetylase [Hazenella sp. IB182353]|uniref:PIG-L deacetylase family protein n=1 Tax=Polycladospora coralii TaxID=2771432 RepID=UPI0017470CB8|nr:PIG-L family deacetylase [Polycladospora coralii]MBS7531390.1 PIG-L family deacetylase [Polycladospora coralii]